jgi:hypothetical protein
MRYQTLSFLLFALIVLVKLFVVVKQNLLVEQVFQLLGRQVVVFELEIKWIDWLSLWLVLL